MWTKDLIKNGHRQSKACLFPRNNAASLFQPPRSPDYNKSLLGREYNEHFMSQNLLHPHVFTRRREQQPLLFAASTSLAWFGEWMEALLSLVGLLLQPTAENMTSRQQVGEKGGMGGRSHHQHYHFTHTAVWISIFNWQLQPGWLQGSRLRVKLCLKTEWLLFEHRRQDTSAN